VRRLGALASFAVLLAGGCGTPVDVMAPDLDSMMNEHHLQYETQDLTAQALEERIKEIDGYYAEPRSFGKLLTSYETCLKSISAVNGYEALWRGARACAAIALDRNEVRSRRMEYAGKGIGMAREAMRKISHRVEPYYYHALCLSAVADLRQDATRDQLRRMRDDMMLAKSIDETYDFAGPHRFLGELIIQVDQKGMHLYSLGSFDDGLKHLKRAIELFPDYGENHLALARAYAGESETDLARAEIEKVLESPRPKDRTAEHQGWLEEATTLMTNLQGK
jgi:tetratricopeptide (TPR) repeat protein